MPDDIYKVTSLSKDEDFEKAIKICKESLDKNIIDVQITVPHPGGIEIDFSRDELEPFFKKNKINSKSFNQIFQNEISEMINAKITESENSWLIHKIKNLLKDNKDNINNYGAKLRELLLKRLTIVNDQLISDSHRETFELRKTTMNKLLIDIDWDINQKLIKKKNEESKLLPFTTIELSFFDTIGLPTVVNSEMTWLFTSILGYAPAKSEKICLDFNISDIDLFIKKLNKIKLELENFIKSRD